MKTTYFIFLLCSLFFSVDASSQNYWKGGTPGKETDWNTAENWSQNRIPDWTQNVIITDVSSVSGYFPIINSVLEPIPYLEIHSNASLTILPNGKVTVDGNTTFNYGIYLLGTLISQGDLVIMNTALNDIELELGSFLLENRSFNQALVRAEIDIEINSDCKNLRTKQMSRLSLVTIKVNPLRMIRSLKTTCFHCMKNMADSNLMVERLKAHRTERLICSSPI